jgi:hypothetical protein
MRVLWGKIQDYLPDFKNPSVFLILWRFWAHLTSITAVAIAGRVFIRTGDPQYADLEQCLASGLTSHF